MPAEPGFSVRLDARPPRVGVLVPRVEGVSSLQLFELAIATQARVWGGSGNLAVPLGDGLTETELVWELGDRLDADQWAS